MGKGKKAFIDRKNALTFHLVHRSQHDPLITDENAPQHVLVEANAHQPRKQKNDEEMDPVKRREEQRKYGIHFDDDYNYLQHLKKPEQEVVWEYVENPNQTRKRVDDGQITSAAKLNLPSSVFATEFEEDEGMLNKAALHPGPRPDWDPDIVAALDDDFEADNDEDNLLEDDFVLQAMAGSDSDEEEDDQENDSDECSEDEEDDEEQEFGSDFGSDSNDSEMMDRLGPLMDKDRGFDENKSRFSEYSISSSVIRRNEQLSLLDERFERFYATYDDPELGDLALENIEGNWGQKHPYVLNCYKKLKKADEIEDYNKEWDRERLKKFRESIDTKEDSNDDEELVNVEVDKDKKKWDCESILSTYSNIYNHPKLIDEPKRRSQSVSKSKLPDKIEINTKTDLPVNVLRNTGHHSNLTVKAIAELDNSNEPSGATGPKSLCAKSVLSTLSVLSIRPKDETPEEKHERKRLLKEYRNERRIEKKANAEAFKEEKKRQTHVKINQNKNQLGNKIV